MNKGEALDAPKQEQRRRMMRRQIEGRGVADRRVLNAVASVPREAFAIDPMQEFAYADSALPISAGQTMSQPYIVAKMAELAALSPNDTVLEVGAGSGYAAAVLGRLCRKVYAIERRRKLVEDANQALETAGVENVEIIHGDGAKGLCDHAPYDAIIVSAGAPEPPQALCEQLAVGGDLVMPLSRDGDQVLTRIRRRGKNDYEREQHDLVKFVPLVSTGRQDAGEPRA